MPHRPLVRADNERQHCQHQPQGRRRVSRMSLPKNLWGNHSPALHSTPASATQQTAALVFAGVCTRFYILSVLLSSFLFGLNAQQDFHLVPKNQWKKISVSWTNVAEAPQKVHKLFTKLARASIFYHSAWKQLVCFPISSGHSCTALTLILLQGPFEATDWHAFSVYFLIKKNHMH